MIFKRHGYLRCFVAAFAIGIFANIGQAQLITGLTVDVSQDVSGLFTYTYTLENDVFSSQSVNTFLLTTGATAEVVDIFGPNENWFAGHFPEIVPPNLQAAFQTGISDDGLDCGVTDEFDLFPGSTGTFTITSLWGPETTDYVIGSTASGCDFVGDLIFGDIEAPSIPPVPTTLPCDFDEDGDCDLGDIDNLAFTVIEGSNDATFDISNDGVVNNADVELFLSQVGSPNGDLDLNGTVEFADFLQLSSNFGLAAEWSGGDLTVDGTVGFPDFLILSENFGQSGSGTLAAVPEPATGGMALVFVMCCTALRRRRN